MTQDHRFQPVKGKPDRQRALGRVFQAAQLFRPRTLARLIRAGERQQQRIDQLAAEIETLKAQLALVSRKERQLRAILETEYGSNEQLDRFDAIVRDPRIREHVQGAVARAALETDPFPHCVVDDLLPAEYYDALLEAIPPADLFADRPENKQQLTVPLDLAPRYAMQVWRHMAQVVAETMIKPAVLTKFHAPLTAWLHETLPVLGDDPLTRLRINCSDGRILRRRAGYRIPPHRDPKWGFITCLMYLARAGDDQRWGTQLFRVDDDREAAGATPHWIADDRCRLVRDVEFRPNRMLVFLNSSGAHGAHIPADADPPDLERYAYQFRIGADRRSIDAVRAELTPDQRALWAGKLDEDYVANARS